MVVQLQDCDTSEIRSLILFFGFQQVGFHWTIRPASRHDRIHEFKPSDKSSALNDSQA